MENRTPEALFFLGAEGRDEQDTTLDERPPEILLLEAPHEPEEITEVPPAPEGSLDPLDERAVLEAALGAHQRFVFTLGFGLAGLGAGVALALLV